MIDNRPTTPSTSPIHIPVSYYNEEQRQKLSTYPNAQQIEALTKSGCTVSPAQFLTYYLFHKRRPGKTGYRDYTELSSKITKAWSDLEDWAEFKNGSVFSAPDAIPQDGAITERIGEAGALCVISHLHKLHEADWEKIPEHPGRGGIPTFDYSYHAPLASDNSHIIHVEAKGTSITENKDRNESMRKHKNNIEEKKEKIAKLAAAGKYRYTAGLRYGVITALSKTHPLRCWLLDPPAEEHQFPRRHRLLARLWFLFDWISFLSPRSQLTSSLASRLLLLLHSEDPFEHAGVPLLRGTGKPFTIGLDDHFSRSQGMFAHYCRAIDGPATGTLLKLTSGQLFFIGVQRNLFSMAAAQDFETILSYRRTSGSVHTTLDCVIPRGRARTMGILELDEGHSSSYVQFRASGLLHYSEGQSVFGIVEPAVRRNRLHN